MARKEDIAYQALVQLSQMRGSQPAAEVLSKTTQVIEHFRQDLGPDHRILSSLLHLAGVLADDAGRYEDSIRLHEEAIVILRGHGAAGRQELADTLGTLGATLITLGRYPRAHEAYVEAVQAYTDTVGPDDERTAVALNGLGAVERHLGRYADAETRLRGVADIFRRQQGPRSADLGLVLGNIGEVRHMMNDLPGAEATYREALDILEGAVGPDDPRVGFLLDNLAMVLQDAGRYAEALPLSRRGLDMVRAAYGEDHPDVAFSLSNLATIYREIDDLDRALDLHLKALDIRRRTLGDVHPDTAISFGNLGSLYDAIGDPETALPMYRACLDVRRQVYGPVHTEVANALNNLGTFMRDQGDLETAAALLEEAMDIEVQTRGEGDRLATVLSNLAGIDRRRGNLERAEERTRRAIGIMRAVLGDHHRDLAGELGALAILLAGTGRDDEAFELLREMVAIQDRQIGQLFGMGSERHRARAVGYYEKGLYGFLSFVLRSRHGDPAAVREALDLVLRRKALGAEALAVQRDAVLSGRYPELRGRLEELAAVRARIARSALEGAGAEGPEEHRRLLEEWEQQKEVLEEELARSIPEMSLERQLREADRVAVAAALPEGSALVEFVRFAPHHYDAVGESGAESWLPPRYAAFVLPAGAPDQVTLVDLGEAEPIERMIAVVRSLITGEAEDPSRGTAGDAEPAGPSTATEELRAAVFDPLREALGERTRLFLAPDGDLSRLPFEVLPAGHGRHLLHDYVMSYVGSGRDVLRLGAAPASSPGPVVVAADPDFDLAGSASREEAAPPRTRELDRSDLSFGRLPGTHDEGIRVAELLGVSPWLEGDVLEGRLKASPSPRILHLATHGFFLADREPEDGDDTRTAGGRLRGPRLDNPLLRSGLALAGANTWLRAEAAPPEAEDGILTAEDVTGLDLLSTELVVLSACETGLGEVRRGEGVFGLRRAFVLAGARTLVMSLWKVPDRQTRELMGDLYDRLLQGVPRAEALRQAQLALSERYPHPFFWGAFICQGEPGPLSAQ